MIHGAAAVTKRNPFGLRTKAGLAHEVAPVGGLQECFSRFGIQSD